jgi:hypothetical protein
LTALPEKLTVAESASVEKVLSGGLDLGPGTWWLTDKHGKDGEGYLNAARGDAYDTANSRVQIQREALEQIWESL